MSEWEKVTLSELSIKTEYGYTASAKDKQNYDEPKFLRITDIQGGHVDWNAVPYCDIENNKLSKYKLKKGDIVVARTGNSTGENYMFDADLTAVFASYLIRYTIDKTKAESKFIWYQLRSNRWKNFINNVKGGSAQAGANAKTMGTFNCVLPPLPIQKKIAHILSTLDEKIELNRKMNETLENMAQAIFKSWFVDFEPVKAKAKCKSEADLAAAAKELGISKEVLELFPSEFEESELGMIPKGWEIRLLSDEFNIVMGQSPSGKSYNEDKQGMIFFQGRRDFGAFYPTERVYTTEPKRLANEDDILLSVRAPVGDINIALTDCCIGRGLAALKHKSNAVGYSYLCIQHLKNLFESYNTEGTVFGSINQKILKALPIVSNDKIIEQFNILIEPFFTKIKNQEKEIRILQKTRDTLLPKLLSGELDVSKIKV